MFDLGNRFTRQVKLRISFIGQPLRRVMWAIKFYPLSGVLEERGTSKVP